MDQKANSSVKINEKEIQVAADEETNSIKKEPFEEIDERYLVKIKLGSEEKYSNKKHNLNQAKSQPIQKMQKKVTDKKSVGTYRPASAKKTPSENRTISNSKVEVKSTSRNITKPNHQHKSVKVGTTTKKVNESLGSAENNQNYDVGMREVVSSSVEDYINSSLNTSTSSLQLSSRRDSETLRRASFPSVLSRIKLQNATVNDVLNKYGNSSFVTGGFNIVCYKEVSSPFKAASVTSEDLESIFKKLVQLNLILKSKGSIKTSSSDNISETLSDLCYSIYSEEFRVADHAMKVLTGASEIGSSLLLEHILQEKIELNKVIDTDNKFSINGEIDLQFLGKDFLQNKDKNVVQIKVCLNNHIPSTHFLELFLYAAVTGQSTVHLLALHMKPSIVALYQVKFKFDQLREYNRGTTRKLICDNFYKNIYQHADFKLIFKEQKDLK